MLIVCYVDPQGCEHECEAVAEFARDGVAYVVVPRNRGTYDPEPAFAILRADECAMMRKA